MSLYGHKLIEEAYADDELEGIDLQPYIELAAIYDISRGSDEQIQEFCNSELANVLQERKVLSTKSIQKINLKQKDLKTRIKLMAYQLAASKNDKDYIKMKKYRDIPYIKANYEYVKYIEKIDLNEYQNILNDIDKEYKILK